MIERHGRISKNRSHERRERTESRTGSKLPEHVARFGSILQDERCARCGGERRRRLEDPHGVFVSHRVERESGGGKREESRGSAIHTGLQGQSCQIGLQGLVRRTICLFRLRIREHFVSLTLFVCIAVCFSAAVLYGDVARDGRTGTHTHTARRHDSLHTIGADGTASVHGEGGAETEIDWRDRLHRTNGTTEAEKSKQRE